MSKTKQTVIRKGSFDTGHRVLRERIKCKNLHGHLYQYELEFEFNSSEEIGYNIDFKEIKRVGCQWIDDMWDHGMLLNPHDTVVIDACKAIPNQKYWLMSLNGKGEFCNPTVENIAKELFLAIDILFNTRAGLTLSKITLYETPNCYTVCTRESISYEEIVNFEDVRFDELVAYREEKGVMEYDETKIG